MSSTDSRAQHYALPTCPGQVKNEVGQVKLGSHLPGGASENILDLLSEFLVCHFVNYNLNVTYVSGK